MTEQWMRWEPLPNLAKTYNINAVMRSPNTLQLLLTQANNPTHGISIIFRNSVIAHRSTHETYTIKTLCELDEQHGDAFYTEWSLFKVANSSYMKFFLERSPTTDMHTLRHFAFFESMLLVDVLAQEEPTVQFIDIA